MKIYWWQGGVHIKPETDQEREFLRDCTTRVLPFLSVQFGVLRPPHGRTRVNGNNEQPVVSVEDLLKSLEEGVDAPVVDEEPYRLQDPLGFEPLQHPI